MEALAVEGTSPVSPACLLARQRRSPRPPTSPSTTNASRHRSERRAPLRSSTSVPSRFAWPFSTTRSWNSPVAPSEELFRNRTLRTWQSDEPVRVDECHKSDLGRRRTTRRCDVKLRALAALHGRYGRRKRSGRCARRSAKEYAATTGGRDEIMRGKRHLPSNLAALSALHEGRCAGGDEHGITQFVFAYATLFENRHSVAAFVTKVGELGESRSPSASTRCPSTTSSSTSTARALAK